MMNIDLHSHTKYSFDSIMRIDKIIKIAKKKNLSGMVICDHDYFSYPKLKQELKTNIKDFFLIPGMEIKTEYGDLLGIMLNESVKSRNYDECIDEIRSQGGISILPHPYRRKKGINVDDLAKKVNWIEVNNARSTIKQNRNSKELGKKLEKPITAGSDAHLYREIGMSYIIINDIDSVEEIINQIKQKKVKIVDNISPRKVHYWSSMIGTLKTRQFATFFRGMKKELGGGFK